MALTVRPIGPIIRYAGQLVVVEADPQSISGKAFVARRHHPADQLT